MDQNKQREREGNISLYIFFSIMTVGQFSQLHVVQRKHKSICFYFQPSVPADSLIMAKLDSYMRQKSVQRERACLETLSSRGGTAKSATEPLRLLFYFNYFSLVERVDFTDVAHGHNLSG